jgi:hypothetical protein
VAKLERLCWPIGLLSGYNGQVRPNVPIGKGGLSKA